MRVEAVEVHRRTHADIAGEVDELGLARQERFEVTDRRVRASLLQALKRLVPGGDMNGPRIGPRMALNLSAESTTI